MSVFNFAHEAVETGYRTPCHLPVGSNGRSRKTNDVGYIQIGRLIDGKLVARNAHQVRYEQSFGPARGELDHLCRNRWCCNPAHLEDVSHATNVRRGAATKLDKGEVALIRVLRTEGLSLRQLAREFGVSTSQVHRVVRHERWKEMSCAT